MDEREDSEDSKDSIKDDYLRERYGISQKNRKPWILPAVLFLVFGGAWLIWSADHFSKPEVTTDLIAFTTNNPKEVTIRYFINVRTSSRSHQCILTASDYQANIVGQTTDVIPAGVHDYTRNVIIPIRTPAVSVSIEHCT
ncbi:MAG TPA: DUF4307 domain-containing protein [Candidatus Nanopelagicaceae bacterium]